jgi:general secretion pathway protein A
MYNEYFGFKESPFSIAPDPRYLYMTTQHREALAHLVYGLNSEGGCILLTGEVGTGKTTICRCLLEQIPEQANVALVLNPKVSEIELLETICDELKISYPESNNSIKTYVDKIYEFLIESNRKNEKTVLIIDEAQNLDSKVLEQLRLLTNLETTQRKLLQIIILGQPELLDILARAEMRQLAQRITARFHLQPLSSNEVKAYVSHRLAVAGQNIQLFPENSIKLLYKLSHGVPRLINVLCDRALLGAYVSNQYAVHPPIIKKAATEVFGELKNVEKRHKNKQWLYPIAAFSSIAILGIALLFYLNQIPENNIEGAQLADINDSEESADINDTEGQQPSLQPEDKIHISSDIQSIAQTSEDTLDETNIGDIQLSETGPAEQTNTPVINQAVNESIENEQADFTADNNEEGSITQSSYDNIEAILNDPANNQPSAFQELFKVWNQNYNTRTVVTACKQAETFSLSCLYKQGNLNSLKEHNRPAVLTLINDQGKTRHVTITSIQNDLATIISKNTAYTVRLSDLDQYWYGKFILLWRKPDYFSSIISPGDSGNIVNWLSAQFTDDKQSSDNNVITYENILIEKVKYFQSQHGLTADGIVGPITIIHLNTQSGMHVPTLTKQS